MADINARLKTTPNGPGPQHKVEGANEFEFTEGKDGKLNVRDIDVKAELEIIKQQQQQILQRLDSPIETELTGSNVEQVTRIPIFTDEPFPAGTTLRFNLPTKNIVNGVNLNEYTKISYNIVLDVAGEFSIRLIWRSTTSIFSYVMGELVGGVEYNARRNTMSEDVYNFINTNNHLQIELSNKGTTDLTVSELSLFLLKG